MNVEKHINSYPVGFLSKDDTIYYDRETVAQMIKDIFLNMPTGLHDMYAREIRNNDILEYEGWTKTHKAYVHYANGAFRVQYQDGDEDTLEDMHMKCQIIKQ